MVRGDGVEQRQLQRRGGTCGGKAAGPADGVAVEATERSFQYSTIAMGNAGDRVHAGVTVDGGIERGGDGPGEYPLGPDGVGVVRVHDHTMAEFT